jgi:hypothetical protein
LTITKAAAQSVPNGTALQTLRNTPLEFVGDAARGPSQPLSATLTPAAQGFESFEGTIRALAWVNVGGKQGVASFEVVYQPEVPADWGDVSDAVANGSLAFKLRLGVRKAGRYVLSGRVDDANGQPIALVTFNEELGAGAQEAKLVLFGALIHDAKPKFPLRLRDVDGFLLYENRFPDRSMLPRRFGVVHTSGNHAISQFSNADWNGEERIRHLREFESDVTRTRTELERLERGGP